MSDALKSDLSPAASAEMSVAPNPSGFGAAITGVDLKDLTPEAARAVRQAWLAHRVVWFPDQKFELDDLEAFTRAMGEWGRMDFIKPIDGHPNVLELRREPDEKASHFGAGWHSDYSFQEAPPAATILASKIVPPVGGDTLFADQVAAFEALSPTMQELLSGLKAVHSAVLPYSKEGFYANEGVTRSMTILPSDEARSTRAHPLVRTHGETGRKALYVNRVYTVGIEGLSEAEAQALLDFLFAHATQEDFVYRHKWQPDMVTMWDNRAVQHFADAGFDGHRRVMWRTTTAGEVPR